MATASKYKQATARITPEGVGRELRKLSEEVEGKFREAIDFLEAKKVSGITGDCGFLMNYQKEARRQAKLPCFISAVLQCPLLAAPQVYNAPHRP